MKWPLSSRNKRRIAALLTFVFLVVLMRHFTGKQHVSEMGESFSSVYKDRLVVEGYIYEISDYLHRKELMAENCSHSRILSVKQKAHYQNELIAGLITDYEKTKLTSDESQCLKRLKNNLHQLTIAENNYLNNIQYHHSALLSKKRLVSEFREASQNLKQLSAIQLEVGKQMNEESQRLLSKAQLFSSIDLSVLIVIAVIIQAILFSTRTTVIPKPVKFWLN